MSQFRRIVFQTPPPVVFSFSCHTKGPPFRCPPLPSSPHPPIHCSSSSSKEFRDLLQKIKQNPEDYKTPTASPQCKFVHRSEFELELNATITGVEISEDELSSLATIVATCGLNAALLEMQSSQDHVNEHDDARGGPRRNSNVKQFGYASKKKEDNTDVPGLDKFLVKHVSRLEREAQQAQMSRKDDDAIAEFDKHVSEDRSGQSGGKNSSDHELVIEESAGHREQGYIIKSFDDLEQPDEKEEKENLKCNTLVSKSLTEEKNLVMELREITNGNMSKSDSN